MIEHHFTARLELVLDALGANVVLLAKQALNEVVEEMIEDKVQERIDQAVRKALAERAGQS
jgi:hypothetical protein